MPGPGRVLAVDVGERRVGLAISDPSRTLARPLFTIAVNGITDAVARVAKEVLQLAGQTDEGGLSTIVVGLPARLDGTPTPQTSMAGAFAAELRERTRLPVVFEDERLTSREAEARLARRERDWRKRKQRIDAAAAAIILQDYLDRHAGGPD